MVTPFKEIEKYLKVQALAQGGVGGERDNALKMLKRMETNYPHINRDAQKYQALMGEYDDDTQTQEQSQTQSRHWSDVYQDQQRAKERRANWVNNWGSVASQAFDWATNVASQAFGRMYARDLADTATFSVRSNPSGSKTVNVKIEPSTLQDVRTMDDEQRSAFCSALAEKFFERIYLDL